MAQKFVAFDLEIAFAGPEVAEPAEEGAAKIDTDWKQFRPFGITCAALAWMDKTDVKTSVTHGWEFSPNDDTPAPRMSKPECQYFVKQLQQLVERGYTLLTWNGLGFDFDVLAEESGMYVECAQLAINHVDMMFHFFCIQGYPLGLDAAARGMHLQGKSQDVSGSKAPVMWANGEFQLVLDYVQQDVRATLAVGYAVEKEQGLSWTAKSGKLKYVHIPGWLTAEQAMYDIRVPNTRWMGENAWPRSKFYGWAEAAIKASKVKQPA